MVVGAIDKSSERVRTMFGEIAPRYDRMNHVLSLQVDRWWRRRCVQKLRPQPGDRILDVCTGTGDLAVAFWRQTRGRAQITAADFCPPMLEIGREKQRRLGIPAEAMEFVEADAMQLPFAENTYQLVTVAFGLRNVADTKLGIAEMVRVCRPDGQVAVLEFSTPRRQPLKAAYLWYFKHILPRIGQAMNRNGNAAYDYLPASVGTFPAYEQLAELLSAAGLRDVRFHPLTCGIATLYIGRK